MITFLETLYPDAFGYITIWTRQDERTTWLPIDNLPAIAQQAHDLSAAKKDVYFGVGLAAEPGAPKTRTKNETVSCIPGLWFDFDLISKTKTANLPRNIDEIKKFLAAEQFKPTLLVDSGHGLHGYWLFREPWYLADPEEKLKAADILVRFQKHILARALTEHGWKFDKTADLCRILRIPGTINYKFDPVPVKVIHEHLPFRYNPDDFDSWLPDSTDDELTQTAGRVFETRPTDGAAQLIIDGCAFIQHCRDDAATLPEPEWYAMLTNIARAKDGLQAAHELSAPYPRYSQAETTKKYAHARGNPAPQSCEYIRSIGFTGCPAGGCGVKNPASFALSPKKRKQDKTPEPAPDPEFSPMEKFTDLGNAERFARQFTGQVKHCAHLGGWYVWDGIRWREDDTGQIMAFAKKCVRSMYIEAAEIDDPEIRDALIKHAKKSEAVARLQAMLLLAQHMLAARVDELDADEWLFNVKNGTIDLRTGQLLPHDPTRNITKLAPVTYDPTAKCPTFTAFLASVFADNANIIGFMQRFLGYCLTGDTREQKFAIAYGNGQNGKGTLLNLILDLLGDYGQTTPTDTLMARKSEGIPNDIARLRGARYVLASEGAEGRRFNEPLIKQMTGQDRLAARFLHREFFEFWPQFKIVLLTNDKPVARGDDAALWRRIMLVPFTQKFDGDKCDNTLPVKLRDKKEMSGVLTWMIQGCLEWQKNGLQVPSEIMQATTEYRSENDIISDWMDECCVTDEIITEKIGNLYQNFTEWAAKTGEKLFMSRKKFSQRLTIKGFILYQGSGGIRKIKGIGLASERQEPQGFSGDWHEEKERPF